MDLAAARMVRSIFPDDGMRQETVMLLPVAWPMADDRFSDRHSIAWRFEWAGRRYRTLRAGRTSPK
jgi:hypothetical protein